MCDKKEIEILMTSKNSALVAALISLFVPSFFTFGYFVLSSDPGEARTLFIAARVFLIFFPLLWTVLIDRAGFPVPRLTKDGVAVGFFVGSGITLAGLALYYAAFNDLLVVDSVREKAALLGFSGSTYWFYSLLIIVGNSSLEEYYWRWFNFAKLKNVVGREGALIVSALGFTVHHIIVLVVYFGWMYGMGLGACVLCGGVIFAYLYDRYDCIWSPWICHAVIDGGIMVVGYSMIFS